MKWLDYRLTFQPYLFLAVYDLGLVTLPPRASISLSLKMRIWLGPHISTVSLAHGKERSVGGLAQGHWLGERAPESLYVAFSLTVTVWLPHLQLRHPHSRKEKDAEDVLLFIGKAITLPDLFPHAQWTST